MTHKFLVFSNHQHPFLIFSLIALLLIGCSEKKLSFEHQLDQGPKPWLHEKFDADENKFMFAIVSDLTGGERERIFDVAIEQLNLLRPEFILTVGDLIEGGTESWDTLQLEWDSFDERAGKAKAPLFHLGGNHDLTNPVMRKFWSERYGPRYYHFLYKNVLFLMLDSEDFTEERMQEIYHARAAAIRVLDGDHPENAYSMEYFKMPERATGEISKAQSEYFKAVITRYPNVRWTFLLMHKPVWQREDEGGLKLIEEALGTRPYTVINGHLHSYSHTERRGGDYMILGTTGGSQNAKDENAFDHVTLVTMSNDGPDMVNLRLDGILNKHSKIPLHGDTLNFQASSKK